MQKENVTSNPLVLIYKYEYIFQLSAAQLSPEYSHSTKISSTVAGLWKTLSHIIKQITNNILYGKIKINLLTIKNYNEYISIL